MMVHINRCPRLNAVKVDEQMEKRALAFRITNLEECTIPPVDIFETHETLCWWGIHD